MSIDSNQIQSIVDRVINKLASDGEVPSSNKDKWKQALDGGNKVYSAGANKGVYSTVSEAVEASKVAFNQLNDMSLEIRGKIIEAIRDYSRKHTSEFSRMANEETGLGR